MNLEAIEQHVLSYLGQISNPLVRIDVVYAHLRDSGLADGLDLVQLKSFLARHELFRVMEAPLAPTGDRRSGGTSATRDSDDAYAILASRVPSPEQLSAMMLDQLAALENALLAAREQALGIGDPTRSGPIETALRRVAALREKLAQRPDAKNN